MKRATQERIRSGFVMVAVSATPLLALWGVRRVQRYLREGTDRSRLHLLPAMPERASGGTEKPATAQRLTGLPGETTARPDAVRSPQWTQRAGSGAPWAPEMPSAGARQTGAYPVAPATPGEGGVAPEPGRAGERPGWEPQAPRDFRQTTAYPEPPPRYEGS